jgi:Fe-S cluster assembly iron-binding protein IscA
MALDEPNEDDEVYKVDGLDFVISKPTVASIRGYQSVIFIDWVDDPTGRGFVLRLRDATS